MAQLTKALDDQLDELDLVMMRLTTVRLLMAAGKHHMIDRAVTEMEEAFAAFGRANDIVGEIVRTQGHTSLTEAIAAAGADEGPVLERQLARVRGLERDLRMALAATNAAAEAGLRQVTVDVSGDQPIVERTGAGHRFLTGSG